MDFFNILNLLCGLAFFLFGMQVMSHNLERLSGGRLEGTLKKMTANPLISLGLGAVITIAMQSSSASTVMLVGLSMYVVSVSCISLFMRVARERHPKAMVLASSLEPMAFNIGIAFGTAIGGAVVSGPGLHYVGLVGALFSLVAAAFVLLTLLIDRKVRQN